MALYAQNNSPQNRRDINYAGTDCITRPYKYILLLAGEPRRHILPYLRTHNRLVTVTINSLYDQALGGGESAEKRLFQELVARFRLFVRRRIRNAQDREDVVQQAMLTVCGEYRKTAFDISFAAWAYKVLDNRTMQYFQRKKRQSVTAEPRVESAVKGNPITASPDLKRKLSDCLYEIGRVNVRYARTLILAYQGYRTNEICSRLNLKPNTFYSLLSRARVLLKNCLDREGAAL